jgi:hypothetical protein
MKSFQGPFESLVLLDLSNNQILALSGDIARISTLEHLNLSNNSIMLLPKDFDNFKNIKWINLSKNQLYSSQKLKAKEIFKGAELFL